MCFGEHFRVVRYILSAAACQDMEKARFSLMELVEQWMTYLRFYFIKNQLVMPITCFLKELFLTLCLLVIHSRDCSMDKELILSLWNKIFHSLVPAFDISFPTIAVSLWPALFLHARIDACLSQYKGVQNHWSYTNSYPRRLQTLCHSEGWDAMSAILVDSMVVRVFCHLCLEVRVKPQQSECKSCLLEYFL